MVGLELEPVRAGSALLQIRLGARVGYLFSTTDSFLSGACEAQAASTDIPCSGMLTQFYAALSLAELVRFHLGVAVLPGLRSTDSTEVLFQPMAGIQFILPR